MIEKRLTRGQAIHAFCTDCMGGSSRFVRKCTASACPLFPYRNGREESVEENTNAEVSKAKEDE